MCILPRGLTSVGKRTIFSQTAGRCRGLAVIAALLLLTLACGRTGYREGGEGILVPCTDYPRIVDEPGKVGVFSSVAFDSENIPHIAYYDSEKGQLKYAWAIESGTEGCGWRIEVADAEENKDTGRYPNLVVGDDGQPQIVYFSFTPGTLPSGLEIRLAQRTITQDSDGEDVVTWTITPVEDSGVIGFSTSTVLADDGVYHIATMNMRTQELIYIRYTGSAQIEVVADLSLWSLEDVQISIDLMSSGEPIIVFHHPNNELWAAQRSSAGAWSLTTVEEWQFTKDIGRFASVAADSSGGVHVCSFVWAQDRSELWYHYFDSLVWRRYVIDTEGIEGAACSITLTEEDLPVISYLSTTNNDLKIAYLRDVSRMRWDIWAADYSLSTGAWSDIAVSGSGGVGVSYYDGSHKGLKFYWIGYL